MKTPSSRLGTGYASIPEIMLWVALFVGCIGMVTFAPGGY